MSDSTPQPDYGPLSLDNPKAIAVICPHNPKYLDKVTVPQIEERIQLVKAWDIRPGEHVLELGCGQGDCTVVLAVAVGDAGSVTAVDPADLDYGASSSKKHSKLACVLIEFGHYAFWVAGCGG